MTTSSTVQSVQKFTQDMATFIAYAKNVVTPDGRGRTKFPRFEIMPVIKQACISANDHLKQGDLDRAFARLEDVRKHFQNQQAAWAKGLAGWLIEQNIKLAQRNCPEDLLAPARKAVGEYEALMSQKYFDLDEASKLYWIAVDKLDFAEDMRQRRIKNGARREAQKAARAGQSVTVLPTKTVKERKREEAAQKHRQECAEAANQLEQLVESF